jgi:hypothetical protein
VVSLRILSEATDGTMCPAVDSASKNEYQDTLQGGHRVHQCCHVQSPIHMYLQYDVLWLLDFAHDNTDVLWEHPEDGHIYRNM